MRTAGWLLIIACLLGSLSLAAAANCPRQQWSWEGPWPESALIEWTPDPAAVPGVCTVWSLETWIYTPNPTQAPDVYWLQVSANGKRSDLANDLISVGPGYFLIPLADLGKFGLTGTLNPDDMVTIMISGKGHTVKTRLGSTTATVDGFNQVVPAAARWQRGLVYVSLGMLNKAFNLGVHWQPDRSLAIGTAAAPTPAPTF